MNARVYRPRRAVEHDFTLAVGDASAAVQKGREAAHAVAALLHLAAIGVEDAVVDVRAGSTCRFEHQRLVEADAGMTGGQRAPLRGRRQTSRHAARRTR